MGNISNASGWEEGYQSKRFQSYVYTKKPPSLATAVPSPTTTSASPPGTILRNDSAPFELCLLVLPSVLRMLPFMPFDVANTPASTVAVSCVFVTAVVGKVSGP